MSTKKQSNSKGEVKRRRYEIDDVLVITEEDGTERAAVVVEAYENSWSEGDRVHFRFVAPDGFLASEGALIRGQDREVDEKDRPVRHVDFAKVRTFVELPPEWAKRAAEFTPGSEFRKPDGVVEHDPEKHPSYASIKLSKSSGHTALFGSPFTHQHFISLSVSRATLARSYGNSGHFASAYELIEVNLSEAQWARFVSSVGDGNGVPCTLSRVAGRLVEPCPSQRTEERAHEELKASIEKSFDQLTKAQAAAYDLLNDKAPTKGKREALLGLMNEAARQLTDTVPFLTRRYTEHMAKVREAAKIEVEAYAQRTLTRLGLAAAGAPVALPASEPAPKALEPGLLGSVDGD